MVFAKLQNHEKEAFFSLLDEYFASRPDVFGKFAATSSPDSSGAGYGGTPSAAASAAHRAFVSSGSSNHGVSKSMISNSPEPDPEPEVHSSVAGRIPAFSGRNNNDHAPPHRTAPPVAKPTGASGLVSSKKIGDFDTSSKGAMVGSLFQGNKNKNPQAAAPLHPPAFPSKKNTFAPPPTRHTSETPAPPRRQPEPEPEPESEPELEDTHGEWALALYDYNSQDPGDLQIKENEHVLVTERTSDDWWTGEYNGHKGLFPASYVKLV